MSSSDPRRLLDYGDDLQGLLKGALEAERAAPLAGDVDMERLARIGERIAAATGAASPGTGDGPDLTSGAEPATTTPATTTATAAATGAKAGGAKVALLALASAAVVGAVAIGFTRGGDGASPPSRASEVTTAVTVAPEHTTLAPASAAPTEREPRTVSLDDLPTAPLAKSGARAAPATEEEIALLARAQQALHGAPREALALCDEHATKFRSGSFGEEREAVAVEALVALGRKDEAAARFAAFRGRWPASSHRVHLEGLFGDTSPTTR